MSDANDVSTAPKVNAVSIIKLNIRRLLLVLFAAPAIVIGAVLLLPILLDDPALNPSEDEQQRSLIMIAASLVATYVVHRLTRSWSRNATTMIPEVETQHGN